jgi:hypothetical protein
MSFTNFVLNLSSSKELNKIKTNVIYKNNRNTGNKYLDKEMKEYDEEIKGRTSKTRFKSLIIRELPKVKTNFKLVASGIDKIISAMIPNSNSQIQYYTDIRKALNPKLNKTQKKTLEKYLYSDRTKERNKAYVKKVEKKNVEQTLVDKDKVISVLEKIKGSNNFIDMVIFLQLTIGGRLIDILKVYNLSPVKNNKNKVKVTGSAKSRGKLKEVIKPILFYDYEDIKEKLDDVRYAIDFETSKSIPNDRLTNKYFARINRKIAKLFDRKLTSQDLRKIYGNLSYTLYAPKNMSLTGWLKKILLHESLTTSLSYQTVKLVGDIQNKSIDAINTKLAKLSITDGKQEKEIKNNKNSIDDNAISINEQVKARRDPNLKIVTIHRLDSQESKLKRLTDIAKEMKKKGVSLTHRNLKKHAKLGSRIVSEWKKQYNVGDIKL